MAEVLPPGTPEVDDPLLVADLIALLSIKGAIGRLPLADIVIPVVILGEVTVPEVNVLTPSFRSVDVFSAGIQSSPGADTIHADTTALVAGTYDVQLYGWAIATTPVEFRIEHRDAANAANLAEWFTAVPIQNTGTSQSPIQSFAYELGENERLRILNRLADVGTLYAVIFARLRT